jgi:NRPS condensation-like uncharacterized protein
MLSESLFKTLHRDKLIMVYTRKISPVERIAASHIVGVRSEPIQKINQFVLEGEGTFDVERWRQALERVAEVLPALRSVWKGHGGRSYWQASGPVPAVVLIENSQWDGRSDVGAPFLERSFDLRAGPCCEVILLPGSPARVVFRTHHALMDGMGTRVFIDEVFKALRAEELDGNESALREIDLLEALDAPDAEKPALVTDCLSLDGDADGRGIGCSWRRQMIPGNFKNAAPAVMYELSQLIRSTNRESGSVRLRLTIDLRRHLKGDRTIGNLTNFLMMDIAETDSELDIRKQLLKKIKTKQDLYSVAPAWLLKVASWIPMCLFHRKLKNEAENTAPLMRKLSSGIISSLGGVDDKLAYDEFTTRTAFAIPVFSVANFFLSIWENPEGLDIALAMPDVMASKGRLDKSFEALAARLSARSAKQQKK